MEKRESNSARLIRNILIAAGLGIVVGVAIGILNTVIPGLIPQSVVLGSVGVTIGVVFSFLHFQKTP